MFNKISEFRNDVVESMKTLKNCNKVKNLVLLEKGQDGKCF